MSKSQSNFNDEAGDSFQQNNDNSHLGKDSGIFESPDFRFSQDTEIILGSGIGSFRSRSESLEFSIPVGSSDDLQYKTRELSG